MRPGVIHVAIAWWHTPPDTALHDLPYDVHCPVTDSLMQVTSTGVPGGQSLLVARTLHLQKKSKVVLRVGQTPALPASLRCREQVMMICRICVHETCAVDMSSTVPMRLCLNKYW